MIPQGDDRRDDDLQKLVYGISHDMGASLRTVVQFSNLLTQSLADRLTEKELYWLQLIQDAGRHGQQMIESLKIYSRLVTQAQEPAMFSLQQLIDEILLTLRRTVSQTVRIERSEPAPDILGVRAHWFFALSEILKNAFQYQPRQDDHTPVVRISCRVNGAELSVTTESNGLEVADNQWEKLTVPFKRMQRQEDYPGIGMGLAYCERIARLNHGWLHFSRSDLGGLAVTFTCLQSGYLNRSE
ncbi:sensor histidine kinase [Gynuella sunshinyii]|uniref:histidine kinase n=1 Tax=Gynuella sunshinyii YC6258 TaxID=1445510 RepID=A0A0C5VTA3_9GAMM|nr:ATP-binding protein [Gynuella sunshinyii]AJQ97907.1 bacteriophytochrome (light-regulated signal transduction histidine kinase) [Gynuella sunshinyii YC6258]